MKATIKLGLLSALMLGLAGCMDDEPSKGVLIPEKTEPQLYYSSTTRTAAEAIAIAQQAVGNEETNGRSQRSVAGLSAVKPIITHTSRSESDTLLYVVQYDDNRGFALISAPQNVDPIMAVIDDGCFDSPETSENEAFMNALELTKGYIVAKAASPYGFIDPIKPPIRPIDPIPAYRVDSITPRPKVVHMKTKWSQGSYESAYCPNKVAGCGPVALAQILAFYETPSSMTYTFTDRDKNSETLDWTKIKTHLRSDLDDIMHSYLCSATDEVHKTVGRIIRQIGHLANATYEKDGGTSINIQGALNVLTKYFPNKSPRITKYGSGSSLFDGLLSTAPKRVAYIRGTDKRDGVDYGHAWVADGTWRVGTLYRVYDYNSETKTYDYSYSYGKQSCYIHYNWGLYGNCDGFFLTDIFAMGEGYEYDTPYGNSSNWNFKYELYYIML